MLFRYVLLGIWAIAGPVWAQLEVVDGYVRGLPPGQTVTAAFMTLRNSADTDIVVNSASSPLAKSLEFHGHSHEDGMMRMRELEELRIPAGGELKLSPGGLHLMLIDLQRAVKEGDEVEIEICTDSGECLNSKLEVISVLNES